MKGRRFGAGVTTNGVGGRQGRVVVGQKDMDEKAYINDQQKAISYRHAERVISVLLTVLYYWCLHLYLSREGVEGRTYVVGNRRGGNT